MRLWKVIKEILRDKQNQDSYEDFLRCEYHEYRRARIFPKYRDHDINFHYQDKK